MYCTGKEYKKLKQNVNNIKWQKIVQNIFRVKQCVWKTENQHIRILSFNVFARIKPCFAIELIPYFRLPLNFLKCNFCRNIYTLICIKRSRYSKSQHMCYSFAIAMLLHRNDNNKSSRNHLTKKETVERRNRKKRKTCRQGNYSMLSYYYNLIHKWPFNRYQKYPV